MTNSEKYVLKKIKMIINDDFKRERFKFDGTIGQEDKRCSEQKNLQEFYCRASCSDSFYL